LNIYKSSFYVTWPDEEMIGRQPHYYQRGPIFQN